MYNVFLRVSRCLQTKHDDPHPFTFDAMVPDVSTVRLSLAGRGRSLTQGDSIMVVGGIAVVDVSLVGSLGVPAAGVGGSDGNAAAAS